jgi:DNA topoisomerase IA
VRKTTQVAQRLYEGVSWARRVGRPHHVHAHGPHRIAAEVLSAVRSLSSPPGARTTSPRSRSSTEPAGAQGPTRAIGPRTSTTTRSRSSGSSPDEYALYKLIWNRFVASR